MMNSKKKDDMYREWTRKDTREKKVAKAEMVPIIILHDDTVHRETVRRWNDFAKDIKIDWVRMAQNVLRYNVLIVGKFFNKGSWTSEAWRKQHPEDSDGQAEGPQLRIPTAEERRALLYDHVLESAVCVRPLGTPPPQSVRLTSAGRGTHLTENADQSASIIDSLNHDDEHSNYMAGLVLWQTSRLFGVAERNRYEDEEDGVFKKTAR